LTIPSRTKTTGADISIGLFESKLQVTIGETAIKLVIAEALAGQISPPTSKDGARDCSQTAYSHPVPETGRAEPAYVYASGASRVANLVMSVESTDTSTARTVIGQEEVSLS